MNRRLPFVILVSSLFLATPIVAFTSADAFAQTAKKKKKGAAEKKITSKSIVKWKKLGMADDEIVSRANDGGFKMTPLAKTNLKKAHMSKTLIAALEGKEATATLASHEVSMPAEAVAEKPAPAPRAKAVNLTQIGSDADIDFDSVPPPSNMPKQYLRKDAPVAKKQLDRSTRPSAPFEEKEAASAPVATASAPQRAAPAPKAAEAPRTKVAEAPRAKPVEASASASASSGGGGSSNAGNASGKRRVVFTAAPSGGE